MFRCTLQFSARAPRTPFQNSVPNGTEFWLRYKGGLFLHTGPSRPITSLRKKYLFSKPLCTSKFHNFKACPMYTIKRPNFRTLKSASNQHITSHPKHRSLRNSTGKESLHFYIHSFIFEYGNNNST